MDRIPEDALARPVGGLNLAPGTLAHQLGASPTVAIFLRHFG